ncbi:hypothetical protein FHG87_007804 [Trinorchestia longiramus]|nr:hypothetical protein FHG87_007804 [Trinorchestia longiramus]
MNLSLKGYEYFVSVLHSGSGSIARSSSSSSVSRRGQNYGGATRSSKTRSMDASEMYVSTQDMSASEDSSSSMVSSVPGPGATATVRRKSPRVALHDPSR